MKILLIIIVVCFVVTACNDSGHFLDKKNQLEEPITQSTQIVSVFQSVEEFFKTKDDETTITSEITTQPPQETNITTEESEWNIIYYQGTQKDSDKVILLTYKPEWGYLHLPATSNSVCVSIGFEINGNDNNIYYADNKKFYFDGKVFESFDYGNYDIREIDEEEYSYLYETTIYKGGFDALFTGDFNAQ